MLIAGTGFEVKLFDVTETSMMDREGDVKEPLSWNVCPLGKSFPSSHRHPFLPPQALSIRNQWAQCARLREDSVSWASRGRWDECPFYLHWRILASTFFS